MKHKTLENRRIYDVFKGCKSGKLVENGSKSFAIEFRDREAKSIRGIIKYMKELPPVKRRFFSEIVILLKILMIDPATNVVSKRSASCLRRLKNWL